MEWIIDPTIWIGLFTLVILEIVLGIDNLIFIAILTNKLPEKQREQARIIGLGFALGLRIIMLISISWIAKLTNPYIHILDHPLSGRDMILIAGGAFLLFKAIMELHERLEAHHGTLSKSKGYSSFWNIIIQIIVIDAVFSIDSIITAVGMVNELSIMITAVVISIILMMVAGNPLTIFINRHPTLIILCLGFLLLIGFCLIVEGLGYHIPKGYIYTAITFSVVIELFNQFSRSKRKKTFTTKAYMRSKIAEAIHRLLGGETNLDDEDLTAIASAKTKTIAFNSEERNMISSVLKLAERSAKSIMTRYQDLHTVNTQDDIETIKVKLLKSPFSRIIVMQANSDQPIGIIEKKNILNSLINDHEISILSSITQSIITVQENTPILDILNTLKKARTTIVFIVNKVGNFVGIVTLTDIMEAIAGEIEE